MTNLFRCIALGLVLLLGTASAEAKDSSGVTVTTTAAVAGTVVSGAVTVVNGGSKTEAINSIKASLEVRFPSGVTPPRLPPGSTSGWYVVATATLPVPGPLGAKQTLQLPYSINNCGAGVAPYKGAKDMRTAATVTQPAQVRTARSPNFALPVKCPVCGNGVLEPGEQCDQGPNGGTCCAPTCSFKVDGTSCSDGNACTQTDQCQFGSCMGSNPVACAPASQCHTAGMCNAASGICSNPLKANGTACNDGDACTQTDSCQSGTCRGSNTLTCPAVDQCQTGLCEPQTGACSSQPKADGSECADGNACTLGDSCVNGECTSGTPRDCEDHMTCTDDVCLEATGCSHTDTESCVACDPTECVACGEACDAAAAQCAENCWSSFWACVGGCTSTYCAPFCQADLSLCLGACPGSGACWAACEAGNGCASGCAQP